MDIPRRRWIPLVAIGLAVSCRSMPPGPPVPDAESVMEGTAGPEVHVDSIDAPFEILLERGRWQPREVKGVQLDFWSEVERLDVIRAARAASSLDERTLVAALSSLLAGDPDAAAVALRTLYSNARDPMVRSRARVGLTMALTWTSDWEAIAAMEADHDSMTAQDPRAGQAGVERWAHAFAGIPQPVIALPDVPITLPMRRSAFGTPVVTVRVNGKPHEFWLDTGASMTLLSAEVAVDAGVRLAAPDTLALGVVSGHIDARAVFVDSVSIGSFSARGLTAAVVTRDALRLDHSVVSGLTRSIPIDGVIGADLIRHMDLVIDAAAGTLTIGRPARPSRRGARNLYWLGYPVVRLVSRDGQPLLFGLDTGAEGSFVTPTLLRKLPRTPIAARRTTLAGFGSKSLPTEWVVRDIRVSDGDYAIALRNAPVAPEHRWTFVNLDGMIGSDVALATRLHLDFTNGIFDIRPSDAGARNRERPTKP